MPRLNQPETLKDLALSSIYSHIRHLSDSPNLKKTFEGPKWPKYIIGPYETLSGHNVHSLLKKLYRNNWLNKAAFALLLHNRLKFIDFSFIKKTNLVNGNLCQFIGNNCYNITELNLFAQNHLTPKNLCEIIFSMKNLKRLNLAHTQANLPVTQLIASVCTKLQYIELESCSRLYEDCIEDLALRLYETIEHINVDFIPISEEIVEKILLKCKKLRFFSTPYLTKVLFELSKRDELYFSYDTMKIERIEINSHVTFKSEMIEAIEYTCPELKSLTAIWQADRCSNNLDRFNQLSDLVLGNSPCLMSFNFKDLLNALKGTLGPQLRSLHLISVNDVNLKSISLYCKKLVKLAVEMIGNYEPALDDFLNENGNEFNQPNQTLKFFSISRPVNKYEESQLNVACLKNDIQMLLGGGQVRHLEINGLNEFDDEYFISLFSSPTYNSFIDEEKFLCNNIEVLKLKNLIKLSEDFIINFVLLDLKNVVQYIDLDGCRNISKKDVQKFKQTIQSMNMCCVIKWA